MSHTDSPAGQPIGGKALRLRMVGHLAADGLLEVAGHEDPHGTVIRDEESDSSLDGVVRRDRHRGSLELHLHVPSSARI